SQLVDRGEIVELGDDWIPTPQTLLQGEILAHKSAKRPVSPSPVPSCPPQLAGTFPLPFLSVEVGDRLRGVNSLRVILEREPVPMPEPPHLPRVEGLFFAA